MLDTDCLADALAAVEAFGADAFDWIARMILAEPKDHNPQRYAYLCAVAIRISELTSTHQRH